LFLFLHWDITTQYHHPLISKKDMSYQFVKLPLVL
jgi:hypothetical protein